MTAQFSVEFASSCNEFFDLLNKNGTTSVEETPDQLNVNVENIDIEVLRNLGQTDFAMLFDGYPQDTLSLSLISSTGRPFLNSIKGSPDQPKLDELKTEYYDNNKFSIEITMDKKLLVDKWGLTPPDCQLFLYFYPDNLKKLLAGDLKSFEYSLWKKPSLQKTKFLFLVNGWEGIINGDLLAVAGGKYLDNTHLTQLAVIPQELRQKVDCFSKTRSDSANLKWDKIDLQYLTPCHFSCLNVQFPPEPVGEPGFIHYLQFHFLELFCLYTADLASQEGNTYRLTYDRKGSEASLTLLTMAEVTNQRLSLDLANTRNLMALLDEIYDIKEPKLFSSRLALAQGDIGQTLREKDTASDRYNLLLTKGEAIKNEYDRDWSNLWDDKVENYLGKVKDLEELVNKTVSAFADQVADLIKSLTDTALAAIATIVGTLVASLLTDKFKPIIFIAGVVGYGLYLIIIQGLFNLVSRQERFRNIKIEYAARRIPFVDILKKEKVEKIEGTRITDRGQDFANWYQRIWALYWILLVYLVVLVIVGFAMPIIYGGNLLEVGNPATPTPLPVQTPPLTPTASPIPFLTPTIPTSPR